MKRYQKGEDIYVLHRTLKCPYWLKAKVMSVGTRHMLVEIKEQLMYRAHMKRVEVKDCARPSDKVAIVVETWSGNSRVDRGDYPQRLFEASEINQTQNRGKGRITEAQQLDSQKPIVDDKKKKKKEAFERLKKREEAIKKMQEDKKFNIIQDIPDE
jgi:hypothetical protein